MVIEELALIDSTNSELLRRAAQGGFVHGHVLIARAQSAGRGRANRVWVSQGTDSGPGNLYMSMMLALPKPLSEVAALTLALGVAARRALGLAQVQLKWPNDLQINGKKLGGILLEVAKATPTASQLVAGIGINICLPAQAGRHIDQPYTDLHSQGVQRNANSLAVQIAEQWLRACQEFSSNGLQGFMAEFHEADALFGQPVQLIDSPDVDWRAQGIAADGTLCVVSGEQHRFLRSGEVSVRTKRSLSA